MQGTPTTTGGRDSALQDSDRASDPVAFIAPAQKEPNDTPLDKECGKSR